MNATIAHLRKAGNEAPELRQTKLEAAAALEAGDLERAMDRLKAVREHVRRVFEQCGRNQRQAAQLLDISRGKLARHLARLDLK